MVDERLMELLVRATNGADCTEEFALLDEQVRSDPAVALAVAQGLQHLADLEWDLRGVVPETPVSRLNVRTTPTWRLDPAVECDRPRRSRSVASGVRTSQRPTSTYARRIAGWAAAFAAGVACAWWSPSLWRGAGSAERSPAVQEPAAATAGPLLAVQDGAAPVATLVSNTSFMWDAQAGVAIQPGAQLQPGKSVALFDGVAEVQFTTGVTTRLKGPAILTISSEGVPELRYGRVVTSNLRDDAFRIDVPLAQALVGSDSLVGVDAFGEEAVVHVLEGTATLTPATPGVARMNLGAGEAVRLRTDAHSELAVQNAAANPATFDFDVLMASDSLHAGDAYAQLVMSGQPLAYWRFETFEGDIVPNEMGTRHALRRQSDHVRLVRQGSNGHAEFVLREAPGGFLVGEPFDELAQGDYSVECWMKPSHYHRGTIAALMEQSSDEIGSVERHAFVLEIDSAHPWRDGVEGKAKSVRFLHRSPPHEVLTGTACFSAEAYALQKWQHVAAVKAGDELRLYLDGRLTAQARDATSLTPGLRLVVGQLFSFGTVRPFVGHLDELAVYARALADDEVRQRVDIVRRAAVPGNSAEGL